MASVDYKTVNINLKGVDTPIKIKTSLSFGEFRALVSAFNLGGEQTPDTLFETLYVMLKVAILDGPIKDLDREGLSEISADSVTQLVGEVRKIIPLEKYLKNLGLTDPEVEKTLKP